jgi:hypothetical protein
MPPLPAAAEMEVVDSVKKALVRTLIKEALGQPKAFSPHSLPRPASIIS